MIRKHLEIHSENILPIIKKWLYSDKDIFVRELVSNACDAIYKVKILRDQRELANDDKELRIDVTINKEARTLTFSDTGIGMDAEEVQKYIAQIAFSGAEEFLDKYKGDNEKEQVIGHFGLGFYSAYMVASKVDINTLSYKPNAEPVFWTCDGSSEYEMDKGTRTTRGTDVILHVDAGEEEYLEETRLKHILHHYCDFLPYPIYLNGTRINTKEPLWVKAPADCTKEEYLEFYRHLYPMEEAPLFWVHLNVDYPFHLKGILYFPKVHRNFDINKSSVKLYCNRVFVADNCKDILPEYLMALRGVIDSPDIPLNVSRSYLQTDRTVRQLASHISKKVCDSLTTLYRNERDRFIEYWHDVSLVVKLGVLEDEKFYERVKEILIWKTLDATWTTAEEYLERNQDKTKNKIYYAKEDTHTHLIDIYKKRNIEILLANSFIDSYLISFLEKKLSPVTFQRIDADLDESLIDKEREKTVLDAEGKTEATVLADFIRTKLADDTIDVQAKSLTSDAFPGFIMIDESQRRMREYMQSLDPTHAAKNTFFDKHTFIVNTNSSLLATIKKMDGVNPELAKEMVHEVYEIALLSQREMSPENLQTFIARTNRVLEQLAKGTLSP
ncbi:MAG: molecular chaperone HtpG [Parachlamydiaceae bacterium]|nr:molecular chaperone HtpG [Parachlamydiaceae bacterium]